MSQPKVDSTQLDIIPLFPNFLSGSTSGYQKLPNGLILQWGSLPSVGSTADVQVSLPIAFPSAFISLHIFADYTTNSGIVQTVAGTRVGETGLIARGSAPGVISNCYYLAMGY